MPLPADFMQQLLATFTQEAREHLQTIVRLLLVVERHQDPAADAQTWADIFRAAHSLKGAAQAVSQERIGTLAHHLETLFGRVKNRDVQPTPTLFDLSYQALDAAGLLLDEVVNGTPAPVSLMDLFTRIETLALQPAPVARSAGVGTPGPLLEPAAPSSAAPETNPPVIAPVAEIASASVIRDDTVRVAVSKLDTLLNEVGELQAARLGTEQRLAELTEVLQEIEVWENDWRKQRSQIMAAVRRCLHEEGEAQQITTQAATRVNAYLERQEAHLHRTASGLRDVRRRLQADNRRMTQVVDSLEEDVRRTRMLPVEAVLSLFPRMVRDLARAMQKQVTLVIEGADTEVDRSVLEQIKDPLTHLLRNAIDHGLERPEQRQAAGKPVEGVIRMVAAQRGNRLVISVADDGRGIDLAAVRGGAVRHGLMTADEAAALDDREALALIFRSGFSTTTHVSDLSGRGVGLDVVRENVERLGGMVEVESQVGAGTCFELQLPLTLATTLCLLVRCREQTFAIPVANVARVVRSASDQIAQVAGRQALVVDGRPLALHHLADILGLPGAAATPSNGAPRRLAIIVLGIAERRLGFQVDSLMGVQEVVTKSLPKPLLRVRHVAGVTILGTGEIVVVLNVTDLVRDGIRAASPAPTPGATGRASQVNPRPEAPLIVVADDSFTTRTLEKNILEAAGYRVRVAADGMEAWTLLQSEHADLLVSDINMPRMDGFELVTRLRQDERFKHLPAILITSLDSREDRERGIQAGADAYFIKSAFNEESLLAAIRRLL
ncbi:MAG: hybrid sensor histidine kinase/response regulator [Anaerolineae bacterium]